MTALPFPTRRVELGRALAILAALGLIVAARWAATVRFPSDGLLTGVAFGVVLLVLAAAAAGRVAGVRTAGSTGRLLGGVTAGLAIGLLLVVAAVLFGRGEFQVLRPAAPFLPWVAVTALVASAEEIVLRGILFGALEQARGTALAIAATALVFAVMHVPFYGPQVLPLDLGVGLVFGGLRASSGGVTAPAFAHVIADLATWWL